MNDLLDDMVKVMNLIFLVITLTGALALLITVTANVIKDCDVELIEK